MLRSIYTLFHIPCICKIHCDRLLLVGGLVLCEFLIDLSLNIFTHFPQANALFVGLPQILACMSYFTFWPNTFLQLLQTITGSSFCGFFLCFLQFVFRNFCFFGHCHNHIQLCHNNINTCPGVRYGSASTKQNDHYISVGMVPLSHHHIPTPQNMTNCHSCE